MTPNHFNQRRSFFSCLFGEKETSSNASPIHELGKFLWDIEVTSGDDGKEAIIFHNHMDLTLLSLSKQQLKKEKTQIFRFCGGEECECQRDGAGAVYFSEISLFRCIEWTESAVFATPAFNLLFQLSSQ